MSALLVQATATALPLRAESVQCVVTSPPYWGLRDYDVPGQLGLEPTPELYVEHMVEVFREVRRVLRSDGVVFLNLGDCYNSSPSNQLADRDWGDGQKRSHYESGRRKREIPGLKPKDLVGIPWRVAFALQADGWWLRADIVWSKPNPMPESVRDRPTKSHEYVFLLSKSERYYYGHDEIREPSVSDHPSGKGYKRPEQLSRGGRGADEGWQVQSLRNARTVWEIATQPYAGAHFAAFPERLAERCVLAGSRRAGKQCDCDEVIATPLGDGGGDDPTMTTGRAGLNRERGPGEGTRLITRREQRSYAEQMKGSAYRAEMATVAAGAFEHYIRTDRAGGRPPPQQLIDDWTARGWLAVPPPCACLAGEADIVLDPFAGTSTVGRVAVRNGRRYVGVDISRPYLVEHSKARLRGVETAVQEVLL